MKKAIWIAAATLSISTVAIADSQSIMQQALSEHNRYRSYHHAPALEWDNTLAAYANAHASHCEFRHSHSHYGENLAMGYPTITAAIHAWYAEKDHYHYWNPGFSYDTGHFTQVVWKSTRKVGCGYADCDRENGKKWKLWVCEYSPAGNVVNRGYFSRNVTP